ncbi:hypothetical protein [Nakamurella sp.]|uniref:hypothetical protein n=1 Tax=Nakamurella sp. TaxID=1869182 RepID=UPI003783B491
MSSPAAGGPGPALPHHPDPFVTNADPAVLRRPTGDLVVHVGEATRAIDEILLIAGPVGRQRPAGMRRPAAAWCTIFGWLC